MNRLLAALALALFVSAPARAASTYSVLTDASSTTIKLNGRLHMQSLAGVEQLIIDSVKGLFTWTYGIQASTMSLTGTGNTTYSLTTSSGVSVAAGGVTAPWFSASTGFFGSLFGNATTATSATTATTATNLAGGAAGQVHYQSGAGASAFLTAGAVTQALMGGASAPAWSTLAGSTIAANISGLAARATALGTTPTACAGQASTGVDINGNAIGCFSAGTGDVTQAGNNTMTGINTFSNISVTTNASNGTQIITIAAPHGMASGIEYSQVISTSGVWSSLMFAGLDANAEYELMFDSFTLAGGGDVIVRFGTSGTTTDSTAGHYVSTSFSFYNTTTAAENPQPGVATACFLDQTAQAPKIGYASRFRITFSTGGGGPMIGYFSGSYFNSSSNYAFTSGVCAYTPTSQIVNVAILPAVNFSGTLHLKRIL